VQARFLQEARITGQLEHPGIVPVYELARQDGTEQSYYIMRFVKGRTLSEVIAEYHRHRVKGEVPSYDLVALLNSFVAVCNTVAYAHSRGIIHRDLKGQNVVLGDFGEVVLLDWGLAKRVKLPGDSAADTAEFAPGGRIDPNLVLSDAVEPDLTLDGQAVGTPAFMAPEQAAGRIDQIGVRTDVYGLGAILYQILTGQTPFTGADVTAVLKKVQSQDPIPPRQLNDEVPVFLEAACLKALAKDPADRYSSARELAREIEHWQEVQRKQAELALRDSEALYHSLVDMLPLMLIRKDLESRFTFANNWFCQSLGRPLEEIVGKTDFDFFPPEIARKYQQDDRWVLETGKTLEATEENIDKRQLRYVQTIKTPIHDSHGKATGVQVICWDVSENKRLREELEKVTAELAAARQ
jgi:PAS domain S-box-containing protein